MSLYFSKIWWQNCYRSINRLVLRFEIWLLLYSESDLIIISQVDYLIRVEKYRHPNKSEDWYLKKIIYDLRQKFVPKTPSN